MYLVFSGTDLWPFASFAPFAPLRETHKKEPAAYLTFGAGSCWRAKLPIGLDVRDVTLEFTPCTPPADPADLCINVTVDGLRYGE